CSVFLLLLRHLPGSTLFPYTTLFRSVGAFGPFARGLQKNYGLDEAQVAFWDVHELADAEHSDVGDHIVIKGATTPESQDRIRSRSEEHTSELQSLAYLVCRLLLEKKK